MIQHEIKEEGDGDDGEAFFENEDGEDMEEEVVDVEDDPTLEAEEDVEEEPVATSTPRRGRLPRPLVRSALHFQSGFKLCYQLYITPSF
jgi:hypothetical protein